MLYTDDELAAVNAEFLGPTGYTFPWRARYSAYGVGLALAALAAFVMHRLGIGWSFFSIAWAVALVVAATRKIGEWVSFETPLRALAVIFWHELTAPRPDRRETTAVLQPGRVRVSEAGRWVCTGCGSSHAHEHRKAVAA